MRVLEGMAEMKDYRLNYWKDESLADWLARYKEEHGRYPEKPIYCDYRSEEKFQKEIVLYPSDTTDEWAVEDYDVQKHGKITEDAYHIFVPYKGRN